MANTGAHLVDRVVPDVPVRQLVLSIPYELRMLAAFNPDVLTALSRIFVEVAFASYRARAKKLRGIEGGVTGAITLVQRFGGSLNLNVHFHDVFLDGVFTRDEHDHLCFHPLPPPDRDELDAIVRRIHMRAVAWLTRHDYLDEQREHGLEPGAIEACATIAMQRGSFTRLADNGPTPIAPEEPKLLPFVADGNGDSGMEVPLLVVGDADDTGIQLTLTPLLQSTPGTTVDERPGSALPESEQAISPPQPIETTLLAPNILSVQHWNRLAEGELYAASRRIAWGPLLRRTFAVDVQQCPRCHGRLRVVGTVLDPKAAEAILLRLSLPTTAPILARARDPTELTWSEGEHEQLGA
jgi:Putative transposase